jgi:hypothetical protein
MLDTTLFSVKLPSSRPPANQSLTLSGCKADFTSENFDNIYSEFDELNYYILNSNDYGHGRLNIELCFDNTLTDPYFIFYANCFSIRTDNGVRQKIFKSPQNRILELPRYSKIDKAGQLVIGLTYYFQNQEEREKILLCNFFCIEGFIAIRKKNNVYGVMCKLKKIKDDWQMGEGNTYRLNKNDHIYRLYH